MKFPTSHLIRNTGERNGFCSVYWLKYCNVSNVTMVDVGHVNQSTDIQVQTNILSVPDCQTHQLPDSKYEIHLCNFFLTRDFLSLVLAQ